MWNSVFLKKFRVHPRISWPMRTFSFLILILALGIFRQCSPSESAVTIWADRTNPKISFALEEIDTALNQYTREIRLTGNKKAEIIFEVSIEVPDLKKEGFKIIRDGKSIKILGPDDAGLMYGGLELAEQIKLYGLEDVRETIQNPHMPWRGTKFNIPLDLRTPSYSDASDAAQKNIPEMWNLEFWKEYIDHLARYRYNFISLWSLHPFPSMVRVPEYPDIALDDVQRSSARWNEYYHLHGTGLDAPELLAEPEIVRKISIDEKIAFWQQVMQYAYDRNIQFYLVTWNIFTNGTEGKYGITDDIDNAVTRDYFRKSVYSLFKTYPHLAGIGLTTGENMEGATFSEKEDWAFDTYARGVLDAAREMPDRNFTFIHRQHFAATREISEKFKPLIDQENIEFIFSFKYAQAHVFSATTQPFHEQFIRETGDIKTIWTLRNDDNYYFRWGAPDFVRTFIKNIPHDVSRGIYYGSDQWIWGREFLTKDATSPRQIEIAKHWYHWMLWGRLAFNPGLENERFMQLIQNRFPSIDGSTLFFAWQEASMIYPITTGFHWGPLDFQWYIEGCKSRPEFAQNETGFHDVNRFINLPPHPRSGYQSIPDYLKTNADQASDTLISPPEVVRLLHEKTDTALSVIASLQASGNQELNDLLNDIRCMALLGKYYACKISGALHLAQYRNNPDPKLQLQAVDDLENALQYWMQYVQSAKSQYVNPVWMNRVGYVDWDQITEWVKGDIAIAKR
jgi:hypothetical protein